VCPAVRDGSFSFEVEDTPAASNTVLLELFDDDTGKDDILGTVNVTLTAANESEHPPCVALIRACWPACRHSVWL
jgi:hypothetical protein